MAHPEIHFQIAKRTDDIAQRLRVSTGMFFQRRGLQVL